VEQCVERFPLDQRNSTSPIAAVILEGGQTLTLVFTQASRGIIEPDA